jgi:hypothetical protein
MSALAAKRNTPQKATQGAHSMAIQLKMKASTTIYQGSIVSVDDSTGLAEPATAAAAKTAIGIAQESATSASSGTTLIWVGKGVFYLANKVGDLVDDTCRGRALAYLEDDQTVRKTGTGTVAGGKVIDVDSGGVWVEFA